MNFNNAEFEKAFGTFSQLDSSDLPEICFAGRSNVGKSSLINKILNRKSIARVSSKPGKTVTINFYRVDNIPNGYTLKKNVHQSIIKNVNHLQYIEKSRYKYCVDKYLYELNPDYFINKIRVIAASERRMLEWRTDIKSK